MAKTFLMLFVCSFAAAAEVRTLTLKEAVALALKQNPDLLIARYDQARARQGVQIARDPFLPKVYGGSGAAWTSGYPASINGQPPSIFQAQTQMALYNRPLSYRLAQSRENARGADIELTRAQDDIAWRAASMWLDAHQLAQALSVAERQSEGLRSVRESTEARLAEGRALPIDVKKAALDLARAEQRAVALKADLDNAETSLALTLGFPPEDRVRADPASRLAPELETPESSLVETAIANSKEIRLLESRVQAKNLEIKEHQSARWPSVDLVAQYNLLARYNFQDFFPQFQRHNGQFGASITVPLLLGSSARASASQAQSDLAKLQAQVRQKRDQIAQNARKEHQQVRTAESARTVARLDLDVAREQVSVLLAQQEEGRASLRDVEQARMQEADKWIAFYEAEHAVDRARLNLLRQTGTLIAALQ